MSFRWAALLLLLLLGCAAKKPVDPQPDQAGAKRPVEPVARQPTETIDAQNDPAVERMVTLATDHVIAVAMKFRAFDGSCEKFAGSVIELPDNEKLIVDRLEESPAVQSQVLKRATSALAKLGFNMNDLPQYGTKVFDACKGNPAFEAAISKMGIKKQVAP
jgi:hypothetical protein